MALLANKTSDGMLGLRWSKIKLGCGSSAVIKTVQASHVGCGSHYLGLQAQHAPCGLKVTASTDDPALLSLQSVHTTPCNNIHAFRYEGAEGLCPDCAVSQCLLQVMLSQGDPAAVQKLGQAINASLAKAASRPLQSLSSNIHQVSSCTCKQADLLIWCVLPWYAAWQEINRYIMITMTICRRSS